MGVKMKKLILITTIVIYVTFVSCGVKNSYESSSQNNKSNSFVSEDTVNSYHKRLYNKSSDQINTVRIDLSDAEVKQVKEVTLKGNFPDDTLIQNLYKVHALHTELVGLFGCPVEICSSDFKKGRLEFKYNIEDMKCVPEKNLILLHYNEFENCYDTIGTSLDSDRNTVAAVISEPGAYMLADAYEWYGVWGKDVSKYKHDIAYANEQYGFAINIPEEVKISEVSDYLKNDEDGKCKTLLECKSMCDIKIGIEYLERPSYSSAKEYVNEMSEIVKLNGFLDSTGEIVCSDGTVGYYFSANYGKIIEGDKYSINCIFPLDSTRYINIWYGFVDSMYYEKAMSSLESFKFQNKPLNDNLDDVHKSESGTSVSTKNISVVFPYGLKAEAVNEDWKEFGEMVIAPLYKIDCQEYSQYLYDYCFELVKDEGISVRSLAKNMSSTYENADGTSFVEGKSLSLTNGHDGEIVCISKNSKTNLYNDTSGVYDLYGFFETENPDQYICVWFALDKNAPEQQYQELYDCIANIDIK